MLLLVHIKCKCMKGLLMKIKESAENYLETILVLKNKNSLVRSIDVATHLGFSKPSVSVAMKSFREEGYITVDPNGAIDLTEKGMIIAEEMFERHNIIASALIAIGVDEKTAYEDSCKIEHHISKQSFEKIKEYLTKKK